MIRSLLRPMRPAAAVVALALTLVPPAVPARAATRAAVGLTAYEVSGNVGSIDVVAHTASACLTEVCSDHILRYAGGRVYVVGRFGCDNIHVLDPANGLATILQFSVGNGSNPQDIAVVDPHKAYVTRYGSADLWIVDPSTGAHTGTISLASFADADGIPEMAQMLLLAGRLYVAVQRLDRNNFFSPTDHSDVVVIDAATDALVDTDPIAAGIQPIRLTGTNPVTDLVPVAGAAILVGEAGVYGAMDGGVDAFSRETLQATGYRVSETALGGDVSDIDVADAATAFALISDASFNTKLVRFDPTSGAVGGLVVGSNGYYFAAATLDGTGQLLLLDRSPTAPGGVRFFDVATGDELVSARLTFCLPPIAVVALDEPVTAVGDRGEGTSSHPGIALVAPPLVRGRAALSLVVDRPARVRVDVVSAAGRRVRTLADRTFTGGTHSLSWDGRTEAGGVASAGIYLVRATTGDSSASARVVFVP